MKRVLVVAPHDKYLDEPSFRLRLAALVQPMAQRGFEWVIKPRPRGPLGRIRLMRSARDYHAVILHRRMLDLYETQLLRRALPRPRKIVMDIDDATMYHETKLGRLTRLRLHLRFLVTAKIVDTVAAGNAYLGGIFQEASKGRIKVTIIPTAVDPAHYYVQRHTPGPVRLVWVGSRSTLKYLQQAMPALKEAAARVPGLSLVVVCDEPPENPTLPVEFVKWQLDVEPQALLRGHIGLAPTPDDRWTRGKCGFKIVQYMAAGLPVIASPVGMNVDLVRGACGETGLLADQPPQWSEAIAQLATDPTLRTRLGTAGRRWVESELCVEKMADRWAELLA